MHEGFSIPHADVTRTAQNFHPTLELQRQVILKLLIIIGDNCMCSCADRLDSPETDIFSADNLGQTLVEISTSRKLSDNRPGRFKRIHAGWLICSVSGYEPASECRIMRGAVLRDGSGSHRTTFPGR